MEQITKDYLKRGGCRRRRSVNNVLSKNQKKTVVKERTREEGVFSLDQKGVWVKGKNKSARKGGEVPEQPGFSFQSDTSATTFPKYEKGGERVEILPGKRGGLPRTMCKRHGMAEREKGGDRSIFVDTW